MRFRNGGTGLKLKASLTILIRFESRFHFESGPNEGPLG